MPGLVAPFFPSYVTPAPHLRAEGVGEILDPSHPAAKMRLRYFPHTLGTTSAFGAKIYPMALLLRAPSPLPQEPFMTWSERVKMAKEDGFSAVRIDGQARLVKKVAGSDECRLYEGPEQVYPEHDHNTLRTPARNATPHGRFLELALRKAARRVPMSYSHSTSKKRMGSFSYMRAKIKKRIKGALHLIVTRGAYVVDHPEDPDEAARAKATQTGKKGDQYPQIRFNEEDAGKKWSMQGWTYIFYPSSEIYRMPLVEIIRLVRKTLENLNSAALQMENKWLAEALLREAPPARALSRRDAAQDKGLQNVPIQRDASVLSSAGKPTERRKRDVAAHLERARLFLKAQAAEAEESQKNLAAQTQVKVTAPPIEEKLSLAIPLDGTSSAAATATSPRQGTKRDDSESQYSHSKQTPAKQKASKFSAQRTWKQPAELSKATGGKPPDVWKRELTAGLALLARRIPKKVLSQTK
ncbi:hypothetical protein BDZ97DRAFT_1760400 [Flammula alnicola]|nr:hypothetical protein BDZ97DRAFT_1760400 [Flammula alnicola]